MRFRRLLTAPRRGALLVLLASCLAGPAPAGAQTDYYNTDAGRPVRIEDAYPVERYAFELQLAPLRLERQRGAVYHWGVEPELAWGVLPRTHLEIGFPFALSDRSGSRQAGLAGLDVSVLHNLNVETSWPALALAGDVLFPVGSLAPERTYVSAKAIATRTMPWIRVHVNGQYTFGARRGAAGHASAETAEISRWLAGVAADRAFPLRAMLVTGEVYAAQPMVPGSEVVWNAGAGVRYQLDPLFALDAGIGRRLTGPEQSWFVTFGLARVFAIRALMPR